MKRIHISTSELKELMTKFCLSRGMTAQDAEAVVYNYLQAEVIGKDTHGLSKFLFEGQFFGDKQADPEIMLDTGPLVKIDGHKTAGAPAAMLAVRLASKRAKKYGVALVGMDNIQRYGILRTFAEEFDRQNVFGLILNVCEPAMAGFGGTRKVLGSNPLAYPIATKGRTYIVDMSTSEVAMTNIWKALRLGDELPAETFYGADGKFTRDPSKAKAVKNFGGIKGYNLAFLIQLMSGPLMGFKTADSIKSFYDIGYVFLAIDPEKTGGYKEYVDQMTDLVSQVKESGAILPGQRSSGKTTPDEMLIDESLIKQLKEEAKNRR